MFLDNLSFFGDCRVVMVVMMVVMLVTVTVVMVRSTMPGFWSMSFKMELTTTDRSKDN